jgi:lysylphosphatidylglycerol synthetase-like protein (DUF2156 family)
MITMSPARAAMAPRRVAALLDHAAVPLLAALVALIGLQQLWVALTNAAAPTLLQDWLPAEFLDGGRLVVTLGGLFLVVVAHGLARRRREAWAWACGLLVLSALAGLLVTHQGGTALRALAALCLLVALRGRFAAMADPTQVRRRHLAGAGALALAVGYALGGQGILASSLAPRPGLSTALGALVALFTSADLPYRALTPQASWFVTSVPLVGGIALLYALVVALRPALARVRQRGERARVGHVLQRHGRTALSPFALTDDKAYCWSPDGQGVVAYAVANGVAVACGEPLGPPEDRVDAVRHFRDTCRRRRNSDSPHSRSGKRQSWTSPASRRRASAAPMYATPPRARSATASRSASLTVGSTTRRSRTNSSPSRRRGSASAASRNSASACTASQSSVYGPNPSRSPWTERSACTPSSHSCRPTPTGAWPSI